MTEDSLVREVRVARDEYSRQFAYDVAAIVRDLREQERAGGREVVCLPPRRPTRRKSGSLGDAACADRHDVEPTVEKSAIY